MRTYAETVMYRRTAITLYQQPDGFWGWIMASGPHASGNDTMIATFAYRDSAFSSAKRHIDNNRK